MNWNRILDKNKGMDCLKELFIDPLSIRGQSPGCDYELEFNFE
ncbi:MAG: hypothetical protein ACR2MI_01195 [Flavobacteriaceae bacterium]